MHLGAELRKLGALLSCWVHERKHIFVPDFCNNMRNTIAFEEVCNSESSSGSNRSAFLTSHVSLLACASDLFAAAAEQ